MKKTILSLAAFCVIVPAVSAQQAGENKGSETVVQSQDFPDRIVTTEKGTDSNGSFVKETTTKKDVVETTPFTRNWIVNFNVGSQFYIGDNDKKAPFGQWLTVPSINLEFYRWGSPVWGVGAGLNYGLMKGLYQTRNKHAHFMTDEFVMHYNGQDFYRQKASTLNLSLFGMVDLDNLFAGYNPARVYNCAIYAGGGVIAGFDRQLMQFAPTFNAAIINTFRVSKFVNLTLNIRGVLVGDDFDGEDRLTEPALLEYQKRNVPFDGILGVTFGVSYRFGTAKYEEWTRVSSTTTTSTQTLDNRADLTALQQALAAAQKENAELRESATHSYDYIKDPMHLWYHVQFVIDKWDVSRREMVNLKAIAEIMKKVPNTKFELCGYADKQTATPEHNVMLARNRVNEVYDIMTKELGVNPDQLVRDSKGGVDLMFYNDNTLSRCVIIKTAETE